VFSKQKESLFLAVQFFPDTIPLLEEQFWDLICGRHKRGADKKKLAEVLKEHVLDLSATASGKSVRRMSGSHREGDKSMRTLRSWRSDWFPHRNRLRTLRNPWII